MKTEIVTIEKIVFGGDGLGRLKNGKVVFVPYVLPGEKVKVKINEEHQDYAFGELVEILEESEDRVSPPCQYYFSCGGCQFQHLSYDKELSLKEEVLKELFRRQGFKGELPLREIVPSSSPFFYRNKLRLHVLSHPFRMGFVKRRTHEVLEIKRCLLGDEELNRTLDLLYQCDTWRLLSERVKRVRLEKSLIDNRVTLLFWSLFPINREDLERIYRETGVKSIFYYTKGARPHGPYPPDAPYGGRKLMPAMFDLVYYVQPGVFTQSNWEINLKIMQNVFALGVDAEAVLDLHSGMGNFLLPLVKGNNLAREFLGVDTDPLAIEDGLYTAERNGLNGRLDFQRKSSMEALYEAVQEVKKYDLILLDPPRGGCRELIRLLPDVAVSKIVYISCDPPTLVRDVLLLEKVGFYLKDLIIFDMFPRTYHFEVFALLEKSP